MRVAFAVVLLILPTAALSSETTTFTYDALGRLIVSSNSGGPRNGGSTTTNFDPVGNRSGMGVNQPPPTQSTAVTFSVAAPGTVTKGNPASFLITKAGPAASAVSLSYATSDGTATAPTHYTATSGTMTFLAWETQRTIVVSTINTAGASPARTFSLVLSSPSTGGTISTGTATATIAATAGTAPVTQPDSTSMNTCRVKLIDVVANDTDPSGAYPLTLIAVSAAAYGSATVYSSTTVRYQSYSGSGGETLTYTVQNATGGTATGSLSVTVTDQGGCD